MPITALCEYLGRSIPGVSLLTIGKYPVPFLAPGIIAAMEKDDPQIWASVLCRADDSKSPDGSPVEAGNRKFCVRGRGFGCPIQNAIEMHDSKRAKKLRGDI